MRTAAARPAQAATDPHGRPGARVENANVARPRLAVARAQWFGAHGAEGDLQSVARGPRPSSKVLKPSWTMAMSGVRARVDLPAKVRIDNVHSSARGKARPGPKDSSKPPIESANSRRTAMPAPKPRPPQMAVTERSRRRRLGSYAGT